MPLEVIVPASDVELLDFAAYRIDPAATPRMRKVILSHYVHRLAASASQGRVVFSAAPPVKAPVGMPRKRLSFKVSTRVDQEFHAIMAASGREKTAVVRHIIQMVGKEVVEPQRPKRLEILRMIVAASS